MEDDRKLAHQARRWDAEAFARRIAAQEKRLYILARSLTRSDADAADALQEAILTCWEKRDTLQKEESFASWMRRILVNKCNDLYREKIPEPAEEIQEEGESIPDYERLEWQQLLNQLEAPYRSVLVLYYLEKYNTREIAQILDLPAATVRTRLSRGRKKLREIFAKR